MSVDFHHLRYASNLSDGEMKNRLSAAQADRVFQVAVGMSYG